jgi:biotin carboxylase
LNILILGTNRLYHERLRNRGHELFLMISRGKSLPEDLRGIYREVLVLEDGANYAAYSRLARSWHENHTFDLVAAFNDTWQEWAAEIADELGLFCGINPELLNSVMQKNKMREILDRQKIPNCRYLLAQGREPIQEAIQKIGLPCIVKPVAGEASQGVFLISTEMEISVVLDSLLPPDLISGVLVEEYLVGPEFSVEGITHHSKHHIFSVTEKFKDQSSFVEIGHLVPAPLLLHVYEEIVSYVKSVLTALNYENSPSHTEIILTAEGPRIVETHTRLGGDRIVDLVKHSTGVDLYDLVAQQSCGIDISSDLRHPVKFHQSAAVWYATPRAAEDMKLLEIRGVESQRLLPYVQAMEISKKPGSRGTPIRSSFDRSALAITTGATPPEALSRAKSAIAALEFIYVWSSSQSEVATR